MSMCAGGAVRDAASAVAVVGVEGFAVREERVLSVLALVPELMRKAASWSAIVAQRRAPGLYHAMRCGQNRCWKRSSRRNHVMLDGLRAAGRGAADLSGWLFNSAGCLSKASVVFACRRRRRYV